jgi:hypothetical protein
MSAQTVTTVSNLHIGPVMLTHGFTELESDSSGTLYALRSYSDGPGFPPEQFNEIIRITNPAAGNSLLTASYGGGFGQVHTSLAYDASSSGFFAVRNQNGFLGGIDINSAAFTPVSGVAHGSPWFTNALAVDPTTGLAYALVDRGIPIFGTADFTLLSMDLTTGLSSTIGSLGLGTAAFMQGGLRFDDAGVAYTVNPASGDVYTVNLATGAATFLFAGGPNAVNTTGLAFIPVPGPAGAVLFAIAAGVAGGRRSRMAL